MLPPTLNTTLNYSQLSPEKKTKRDISMLGSLSPSRLSEAQSTKFGNLMDQSASTLQHSIQQCTFSKADRFPKIKQALETQFEMGVPTTFTHKATSLGYGNKLNMSEVITKDHYDTPAPNHYHPTNWTKPSAKGKSFGLSYEAYRKVYNPHADIVLPELTRHYPGPGAYYNGEDGVNRGRNFKISHRRKMFNEIITSEAPHSNYYSPTHAQVSPSRYKSPSMGVGGRSDFTKEIDLRPGPGAYDIVSKFTQMNEKRIKAEQAREKHKLARIRSLENSVREIVVPE